MSVYKVLCLIVRRLGSGRTERGMVDWQEIRNGCRMAFLYLSSSVKVREDWTRAIDYKIWTVVSSFHARTG